MRKTVLLAAAAIISTAIGSGCARTRTVYLAEDLPLPDRPVLPRLTPGELQCLSEDAYYRLMMRDMLRRQYAEELETIIRSTWNDQGGQ